MAKQKEYDLIVPMGLACIAASQLRFRKLRTASLPFDWLLSTGPEAAMGNVKLLESDFANFLEQKNLSICNCPGVDRTRTSDHYAVYDKGSDRTFLHDFRKPPSDNGEFKSVKDRYNRRTARLYERIDKAKHILFVFGSERDEWLPEETLVKVRDRLAEFLNARENGADFSIYAFTYNAAKEETVTCCDGQVLKHTTVRPVMQIYDNEVKCHVARGLDDVCLSPMFIDARTTNANRKLGFLERIHYKVMKHCRKFLRNRGICRTSYDA